MWRVLTWLAGIGVWVFALLAITDDDLIWIALLLVVAALGCDFADYATRRSRQ